MEENPIALQNVMRYMIQAEKESFRDFVIRLQIVVAECQYLVQATCLGQDYACGREQGVSYAE